MGNAQNKEIPKDDAIKTDQPKEYGPEPYFTNPAAHLRQPNYIPELRQPAVTSDDWEELDGEWVIVRQPTMHTEGDWVVVETPQGETKVPAGDMPQRMNRSFTVPVPCDTCGEPFQDQLHSQSVDCVSCSIDKVRDFDEELLDKSSNALKIERQLTMDRVPDPPVKSWADVLKTGPKKFRNPIQETKDAAKAAKAEESIRRRDEEEKADAAYRKQMEHRRFHSESYQRMRKKSEERTNKRRNAVRQMNEMEDHEDFWGVGHENRLDLGYRYGDDKEYRAKWKNLEDQMWDNDSNCSLSCYEWTE